MNKGHLKFGFQLLFFQKHVFSQQHHILSRMWISWTSDYFQQRGKNRNVARFQNRSSSTSNFQAWFFEVLFVVFFVGVVFPGSLNSSSLKKFNRPQKERIVSSTIFQGRAVKLRGSNFSFETLFSERHSEITKLLVPRKLNGVWKVCYDKLMLGELGNLWNDQPGRSSRNLPRRPGETSGIRLQLVEAFVFILDMLIFGPTP